MNGGDRTHPQGTRTAEILGRPFILQINQRAMAKAERESGLTFLEIIDWFRRFSITGTQAFLYMAICQHQPNVTFAECLDLIEQAGGSEQMIELLSGQVGPLLESTSPDPKDVKTLGLSRKRPRKAQTDKTAGTGTRSSLRPVKSA